MNRIVIQKIVQKISTLDQQIAQLEQVQFDLASNGYSSATISSSGGSRSYTRLDLPKVSTLLNSLKMERRKYQILLSNNGNAEFTIGKVLTIY